MKFFGTTVVKYAIVGTDSADYRVDPNGEISVSYHDDDRGWVWCDTDKLSASDLSTILQQGLGALEMK